MRISLKEEIRIRQGNGELVDDLQVLRLIAERIGADLTERPKGHLIKLR